MKILITGGKGFLGSYLLKKLSSINGLKLYLYLREIDPDLDDDFEQITPNDIELFFDKIDLDLVLHCATKYDRDPVDYYQCFSSNLLLPLNLLNLSIKNNVKNFINIDSFFSYSKNNNSKRLPFYKLSKTQFLDWSKQIVKYKSINFINIKLFHLYGHEINSDKFIPSLFDRLMKNERIELSSCKEIRNFLYISDAVNSICHLIKNNLQFIKEPFTDFHLAHENSYSIKDVVMFLKKITSSSSEIIFDAIPDNDDSFVTYDEHISLFKFINYHPKFDLYAGLDDIYRKLIQSK